MADADDPAKAEKLAAAKKRYEQLKKKKKGGKPGSATPADAAEKAPSDGTATTPEQQPESAAVPEADESSDKLVSELSGPPSSTSPPPNAFHARTPSLSQHRRTSSSSGLRRPSISSADIIRSTGAKSPLSPNETLPDIYRKQAETISSLTEANEKLQEDVDKLCTQETRLERIEAEKEDALEQLASTREELRNVTVRVTEAEDVSKASKEEAEKMKSELVALNRQTSHLTSQLTQKEKALSELRMASSTSSNSEDRESLTAKEEQIENMSIDLNKLRHELQSAQATVTEKTDALANTQSNLKDKDASIEQLKSELQKAQATIEDMQSAAGAFGETRNSLENRLSELTAELDSTRTQIMKHAATITSWEKDYATLKGMYKTADAAQQEISSQLTAKEHEAADLESRLSAVQAENAELKQRLVRYGGGQDDEDLDIIEDDERRRLRDRVKSLEEALNRERQRQGSAGPTARLGLSASEAMAKEMEARRQRADDADEERRRLEAERMQRVRETKKGLEKWRGWQMDLTSTWGSGLGVGPVFEV